MLTAILLLFLCCLQSVSAADQNINNTTTGGINTAINNVNSGETVFLDPGNYSGSNNVGITINKNVRIVGKGSTNNVIIDGRGQSQGIFTIGSINLNVSFINITFINGRNVNNGGAINNGWSNTFMTFINCTFINNTAVAGWGGAIYNNGNGSMMIDNCNFTNNTVLNNTSGVGGAIHNKGAVNITNSKFTNNKALDGGAINNLGNNVNITNCKFINNSATLHGGAIYNHWGGSANNVIIFNNTFINNTANGPEGGGAIWNGGLNINISNNNFINNTATNITSGRGGAIYNHLDRNNIIIANNNFTNNKATNGGAIYNGGINVNITNNNFTSNNATGSGAAIYNNGSLRVNGSSFINNSATGSGGAIYNNNDMTLSGNNMSGNNAGLGQVIYNNGRIGGLNLTFTTNSTTINKGQSVTLYARLTDDMGNEVTGQNIAFIVNGSSVGNALIIEGNANISYSPNYSGMVIVSGTYVDSINPINIFTSQLIIRAPTNSTIIIPGTVNTTSNVTISGVLRDENGILLANATITIIIGGNYYTTTTNDYGVWTFSFVPLNAGILDIGVSWSGNEFFMGFTNITNLAVIKLGTNSSIVISGSSKYGDILIINGVLCDSNGIPIANATLTITIGNQSFTVTTNDFGVWTLNYTPVSTGNMGVIVFWSGNNTYEGFTNSTNFIIPPTVNLTIVKTVTPANTIFGSVIVYTITVTNHGPDGATGVVVIDVLDGRLVYLNSTGGRGTGYDPFTGLWNIGNLDCGESITLIITVRINGFGNISNVANVTVDQPNVGSSGINITINVRKTISGSTIIAIGDFKVDGYMAVMGIANDKFGNPLSNIALNLLIDGKIYSVTTKSDGSWNLRLNPLKYGNYSFYVTWTGNATHSGFTNSTFVKITKHNTKVVLSTRTISEGKHAKLTATLKDEYGNVLSKKKITITINKKVYTGTTNHRGIAKFTIKRLKGKKHPVTASFNATDYHHGSKHSEVQVVKPRVDLAIVKIKLIKASNKRSKSQIAYYKVTIKNKGSLKSKTTKLLSWHIRKGVMTTNKHKKVKPLKGGQKKTILFKHYPDKDYHKHCMYGQYFVINPKKSMKEIGNKNNKALLIGKSKIKRNFSFSWNHKAYKKNGKGIKLKKSKPLC